MSKNTMARATNLIMPTESDIYSFYIGGRGSKEMWNNLIMFECLIYIYDCQLWSAFLYLYFKKKPYCILVVTGRWCQKCFKVNKRKVWKAWCDDQLSFLCEIIKTNDKCERHSWSKHKLVRRNDGFAFQGKLSETCFI